MATEIERKYLVSGGGWQDAPAMYYCQGYLNREKQRTVRVRVAGDKAALTIKGENLGASRAEFEYSIPVEDAKQLLELCESPLIEKWRRVVEFAGMKWEIDEFLGQNAGLALAEIELQSEDQAFDLPPWAGIEVTDDPRYFNSNLSLRPYATWNTKADT